MSKTDELNSEMASIMSAKFLQWVKTSPTCLYINTGATLSVGYARMDGESKMEIIAWEFDADYGVLEQHSNIPHYLVALKSVPSDQQMTIDKG